MLQNNEALKTTVFYSSSRVFIRIYNQEKNYIELSLLNHFIHSKKSYYIFICHYRVT